MNEEFRHRTPVQVRFRDIDAFGHVNNAVFFSYVELARIRYLLDVLEPADPFDRMPLILARVEIDYRSPILFGEDVAVETQITEIGTTSFGMRHRMTVRGGGAADERVAAEVTSVLVAYDYAAARPMPVPDDWRRAMHTHEGRPLDRSSRAAPAAVAGSST